jgi:hypothetical protein
MRSGHPTAEGSGPRCRARPSSLEIAFSACTLRAPARAPYVRARRAPPCPGTVRPARAGHGRGTMDLNLTYEELGERLGITRNAARVLAQRRKWHRYTSQDDGKARVRVPAEAITDLTNRRATARTEHVPPPEPPAVRPDGDGVRPAVLPDSRLADMLGLLLDRVTADEAARRDEVARLRQDKERLAEGRAQLQDELQEARAEADHAKADQVRMARGVATMFDDLRAMAGHHADRARLAAELEQARRPWWRRLVGR